MTTLCFMIKNTILALLLSILVLGCASKKNKEQQENPSESELQDKIAFELCEIYGADQGIRNTGGFENKVKLAVWPMDTLVFDRFISVVEEHGFPTKELVGAENWKNECVPGAASAILLHNPHRLINEEKYMNLFINEVEAGRMDQLFLAGVLDKYYWVRRDEQGNRKLLYGSQFGKPCSKYRIESDAARKAIGMEPLKDSDFIECE